MNEDGLRGSRYCAKVLAVKGDSVHIEHYSFNEEAEDGAEGALLREWCPKAALTPVPPPPPSDFLTKLCAGMSLEVHHEDGWWAVTLVRKEAGGRSGKYLVASSQYKTERWAEAAELRPAWRFEGGRWRIDGEPDLADAQPLSATSKGDSRSGGSSKGEAKSSQVKSSHVKSLGGNSTGEAGSKSGPSKTSKVALVTKAPKVKTPLAAAMKTGSSGAQVAMASGTGSSPKVEITTPRMASGTHVANSNIKAAGGTTKGTSSTTKAAGRPRLPGGGAWLELSVEGKVEKLLATPSVGVGGTWEPDGVEAALSRLQAIQARVERAQGLEADEVDRRLWVGAAEAGWRVCPTDSDGCVIPCLDDSHRAQASRPLLSPSLPDIPHAMSR